jgi:hypothetical protein
MDVSGSLKNILMAGIALQNVAFPTDLHFHPGGFLTHFIRTSRPASKACG